MELIYQRNLPAITGHVAIASANTLYRWITTVR